MASGCQAPGQKPSLVLGCWGTAASHAPELRVYIYMYIYTHIHLYNIYTQPIFIHIVSSFHLWLGSPQPLKIPWGGGREDNRGTGFLTEEGAQRILDRGSPPTDATAMAASPWPHFQVGMGHMDSQVSHKVPEAVCSQTLAWHPQPRHPARPSPVTLWC